MDRINREIKRKRQKDVDALKKEEKTKGNRVFENPFIEFNKECNSMLDSYVETGDNVHDEEFIKKCIKKDEKKTALAASEATEPYCNVIREKDECEEIEGCKFIDDKCILFAKYDFESKQQKNKAAVSNKIRKLRKEGYPQRQAVAIALSLVNKGKLGPRGGLVKTTKKTTTKKTSDKTKKTTKKKTTKKKTTKKKTSGKTNKTSGKTNKTTKKKTSGKTNKTTKKKTSGKTKKPLKNKK